jgi:hypothetical protein
MARKECNETEPEESMITEEPDPESPPGEGTIDEIAEKSIPPTRGKTGTIFARNDI